MKKLLTMIVSIGIALALIGCEDPLTTDTSKTDSTQADSREAMDIGQNSVGIEMRRSESIQKKLTETQPQPQIDWSLERQNIIDRTERWNDPNKLSYIYLMSDMGTIVAYFPIRGKVSSVNSALSTPSQIVKDPHTWRYNGGGAGSSLVLESPQEDGSYGTNGDAIFFFLTDGTYVEWSGTYFLSDNPLKLSQEPIMTYEVN